MYLWIALIGGASLYCLWRWLLYCVGGDIQARWKDEAPHSTRSPECKAVRTQVGTRAELRLT